MIEVNADRFKPRFKEKIDMSDIWLAHVNRTNLASSDEFGLYDSYVRQQLRLLPSTFQQWVLDNSEEYTNDVLVFNYVTSMGIKLGTKTDPYLKDKNKPVERFADNSIDWSDPNILSPTVEVKEAIDYEAFNLMVLLAAEKAGLSWSVEIHGYDYGDSPKKPKKNQNQIPLAKTASGHIYANTPSGLNMKIISTIPGTKYNLIDWHGTMFVEGLGYGPTFFDLIQARTNAGTGTIIGTGGAPGDGKTWFDERIGEILNRISKKRHFNPYLQIPFTQEHFLWLLDKKNTPLKPGDVIILDEAHFAAGARNWFKEDQKELVNLIASARNMGFVIILVVLHMSMLDNILRNFTMAFYIHLEKPGYGICYRTFTPRFSTEMIKVRIGPLTLQVPWVGDCEDPQCLKCRDMDSCMNGRAIYERRKAWFQQLQVEASKQRRKEKNTEVKPDDYYFEIAEPHYGSLIREDVSVAGKESDIRNVLVKNGCEELELSKRLITRIRRRLEDKK